MFKEPTKNFEPGIGYAATQAMSTWIDISVPVRHGMPHWPGNPAVTVERVKDMASGASSNVSRIALGVHTATHVDAPIHFDSKARGVEAIPVEALVGPARVIGILNPEHITVEELETAQIQPRERLLFKTRNSPGAWQQATFVEDAVHFTIEAARWLGEHKPMTVAIDYLSVGGYRAKNGAAVHHALIDAGIWIIEGVDLTNVPIGACDLMCLPVRLEGCDGAPARAFVRPI